MTRWNPDDVKCVNCGELLHMILERDNGDCVLWCKLCGAVCCPNRYDPIGTDDYSACELTNERKDLERCMRRLPTRRAVDRRRSVPTHVYNAESKTYVACTLDLSQVVQIREQDLLDVTLIMQDDSCYRVPGPFATWCSRVYVAKHPLP